MNERIEAAIKYAVALSEMGADLEKVERAIRAVVMVTREDMLARDESMETYLLYGSVQKASGDKWTEAEGQEFSERFLSWLEDQGLGYGGLLGEPMAEKQMSKRGEG